MDDNASEAWKIGIVSDTPGFIPLTLLKIPTRPLSLNPTYHAKPGGMDKRSIAGRKERGYPIDEEAM